ncbi:MAG: DUF4445 domain-containing protein [Proteobacteria bacterium]|nr:DUF4445 domain-containing protein [Pseudomonadota bacterium]
MNSTPDLIRVKVQDFDKIIECRPDETLNQAALRYGLSIATACGGEGKCKSCAVRIVSGPHPPNSSGANIFNKSQLEMGWRRSCQIKPTGDCTIYVPRRSLMALSRHLVVEEPFEGLPLAPLVYGVVAKLLPSDGQNLADWERLQNALNKNSVRQVDRIDIGVLRELGGCLRSSNWEVKVFICDGKVIGIAQPKSNPMGIAIDLGTTNIVAFLVNLETGTTLASISSRNPQVLYGGDVVSRLTRAIRDNSDRERMGQLVIDEINNMVKELCANARIETSWIVDMVIAGNTAMHHLLAGFPVEQLGKAPFVPAINQAVQINTRELGLISAPGAEVHLPAIIAGYVGSDHTMVLLASVNSLPTGLSLIIDIGTNTEISIIDDSQMMSASCPSGPALEGGSISYGMAAAAGAIEAVKIDGDQLILKTIEDAPPIGVCGSGVLDIVAQLLQNSVMNNRGRLNQDHPRVASQGGRLEFVLVEAMEGQEGVMSFSQDDIRAVQLAKAAIRAGIDLLLDAMEKKESSIERVIVAGAFGSYIDLESAIVVGLLPPIPLEKFEQVGNAAGQGARIALTSKKERNKAKKLAKNSTYLELSGHPEFMKAFVGRINFDPILA